MEFKDYYKTLGVQKTAAPEDIKKAYRKLARKYHPDVSKESDATVRMIEVNEANEVLSDPAKRAAYDNLGAQTDAQAHHDFRPPPNWDEGFEFSDAASDGMGHSDFFEQLFGRAARGQRAQARGAGFHPHAPARGGDHHAKIELDLVDAYQGTERILTLRSAGLDDEGRVLNDERSLQVKVPKGVREGQHIRLAGRGGAGTGGAAAGDLLLEVRFVSDPRWRAEGRDVYQRVLLSPWEAVLGGTATVRTPGGEAEVTFPAGWRPGRKLRLKGRGLPGNEPGDLYLELDIALPPADTEADRTAYAAMAKAFPAFNPRPSTGN